MYKEVFAERLKKARSNTGLSQTEVAKKLEVDRSTIANYEVGKREPDIETLGKLAEFYGISVDWLLGLGMQGNKPNYEKGDFRITEKILKELG